MKISVDDGLLPSRICRTCYVTVTTFQEFVKTVVHSKTQHESVIRSKRRRSVQQSPSFTRCGTREKRSRVSWYICYAGFLTKLDSCFYSVILTPFEYVRGEEEKIKPTANPVIAYFSLTAKMKFVSILSLCNIALKLKLDSFLSCTDRISENTPRQYGGSLQTRFIPSMRAHVITIYGKRTGRP